MYVCMYIIILNVGISTNYRLLLIYVCMYLFLYIFMYVFMYAIILVYICILGYSSFFFLHCESVVLFTCLQPPRSCDSDGKPSSHSVSNATAGNEINNLISMKLLIEILYFLFGLSGAWTDEPQLKQKKSNSLLKV